MPLFVKAERAVNSSKQNETLAETLRQGGRDVLPS